MKSNIFNKIHLIYKKKWIFISIFFIIFFFLEKKFKILPIQSKYINLSLIFFIIAIIIFILKKNYLFIISQLKQIKLETQNITWAKKKETLNTTLIIILISICISLTLWGIDNLIFHIISFITSF
jgi:preprotein translocase subunit SecE